jgi:hypothetical protein
MLWIAVFCAFCAAPAVGFVVGLCQRRAQAGRAIRGFYVILIRTDDKVPGGKSVWIPPCSQTDCDPIGEQARRLHRKIEKGTNE